MADQRSIGQLISEVKSSSFAMTPRVSMKLWLDEYDTDKGWPIELSSVAMFRLRESMFLKLPIGIMEYVDDGTSRESDRFNAGRLLYIGFEYKSMDEQSDEKSISVGRYRIVGSKQLSSSNGAVTYSVTFIYDAAGMIDSIPVFPDAVTGDTLSTDALRAVCEQIGIDFSADVDTSDLMAWMNPGLTASDFVSMVVAHSFVSEKDFGMFWISKDGRGRFAAMKNSIEDGIPFFFDTDEVRELRDKVKRVIFSDVFQKDLERLTEKQLIEKYGNRCWILMQTDQRNSDGWAADFFGNSEEVAVCDPMLSSLRYGSDDLKIDWSHLTHKITYKQMIPGHSATDSSDREVTRRRTFSGFSRLDLHGAWDFAPVQNSIMRSTFFSNRHTILINTGKQLPVFGTQELKIGDVLEFDFSSPDTPSIVDNGKYMLHTIDWIFQKGSDLYLQLRVSSDAVHPQ